jgi:hypothetical protein
VTEAASPIVTIPLDKMKVRYIDNEPLYDVKDTYGDGIKDLVVMIDVNNNNYRPGKRWATL